MRRSLIIALLVGLLVVSLAGNVVLFQQAATSQAEAQRLRDRLREDRAGLEKRIDELRDENQRLQSALQSGSRGSAAAGSQAPTAGPDRVVLQQIEDQVARLRGLRKQAEVPLRFLDQDSLRRYFVATFEKDYLPSERESDQKLLVALGLLRPNENLVQILLDLLQEQVVGTYNEDEKTMYVIGNQTRFGPEERVTFAHEFVHALQDQHFDLVRLAPKHPDNADRSLAIHAVIEGDAVLAQRQWMQENLTGEELAELGRGGDSTRLDQAPLVVRAELLFPYTDGFVFVLQAYQAAGSISGVDGLFRSPPDSTEQVLHPEKYRAREKPVEVSLPDLAQALGSGWRRIQSNVLGELDLRILLEQYGERTAAVRAAAGWGGDRWQLLEKDGRQALVLKTVWDTENDAREFFEAYGRGLRARFGSAREEEASASRLALTTPGAATELRRKGSEVLAVIAFDRPTAEALVTALAW